MGRGTSIHEFNNTLITAGSLSGDITSSSQVLNSVHHFAVQFIWTGASTPVGSVILQGSNDNITFTDISDSLLSVSGNSGSCLINYDLPSFGHVRVKYTRTSGTGGTVTCTINGKY
jgi:hypothetical protein